MLVSVSPEMAELMKLRNKTSGADCLKKIGEPLPVKDMSSSNC